MSDSKRAIGPRRLAVETLIRVQDEGAYSNIALDAALRTSGMTGRDAAFATALFYLSLERRVTISHCIRGFCPHKLSKAVGGILQTAIAQLLYMEHIPQAAVVNEAVALTRAMGQTRSCGLVNGVLRSFIRAGCVPPPATGSTAQVMSVEYSCGLGLCDALISWYGEDATRDILNSALGAAPIFVRVNTLKCSPDELISMLAKEGVQAEFGPAQGSLIIIQGDIRSTNVFRDGYLHIQDVTSQRAAALLAAQSGDRVLDSCAAPGGKSFTIAQLMGDKGEVVSCDIHEGRLGLIRDGAKRLGISSIKVVQNDAATPNSDLGKFERVLCDAPCSGIGVIRRKPELKYHEPSAFSKLPETQYKILSTSSHYLVEGGRLLYTTCTLNPEENEGVALKFLVNHPKFEPYNWCDEGWMKTFLPTRPTCGDGFFIAAMTLKGGGQ